MVDRVEQQNRAQERQAAERKKAERAQENQRKQAGHDFASRFQSKLKTSTTQESQTQKQDQGRSKEDFFSRVLSTYRGKEESGQQQAKKDSSKREDSRKERFREEAGEERVQSRSHEGHEKVVAKQSHHQQGGAGGGGQGSMGGFFGGSGSGGAGAGSSNAGSSNAGSGGAGSGNTGSRGGGSSIISPFAVKPVGAVFETDTESSGHRKFFSEKHLDDLVAVVTIGVNENSEKEMRLDLGDAVFSGLKLKATQTPKGVTITFICPNQRVKEMFALNRSQIYDRLHSKNIPVHRIEVTT